MLKRYKYREAAPEMLSESSVVAGPIQRDRIYVDSNLIRHRKLRIEVVEGLEMRELAQRPSPLSDE